MGVRAELFVATEPEAVETRERGSRPDGRAKGAKKERKKERGKKTMSL